MIYARTAIYTAIIWDSLCKYYVRSVALHPQFLESFRVLLLCYYSISQQIRSIIERPSKYAVKSRHFTLRQICYRFLMNTTKFLFKRTFMEMISSGSRELTQSWKAHFRTCFSREKITYRKRKTIIFVKMLFFYYVPNYRDLPFVKKCFKCIVIVGCQW